MTTFDLNILPIHRLNGQDLADLPGLLAVTPPRRTARGREHDSLIVYLMLSGNATFNAPEVDALVRKAATTFYQSSGTLTGAMRKAAESVNTALLERNLSTTGRGQYALGILALAAIREEKCTLALSGPAHAVWVGERQARHMYDQALSGKGLGSGQSIQTYLSQVELRTDDLLVLCGKFPKDWEADLLGERPRTTLEATYRKLTFTKGDLHAALIQPQLGQGIITILHVEVTTPRQTQGVPVPVPQTVSATESSEPLSREEHKEEFKPEDYSISNPQLPNPPVESPVSESDSPSSITEEELDQLADFAAHLLQPSAYAIPPQPPETFPPIYEEKPAATAAPSTPRSFPPSIPRAKPVEVPVEPEPEMEIEIDVEEEEEDLLEEEMIPAERPPSRLGGLFNRTKAESKPDGHAVATRQMAKVMVGGIQTGRRVNEGLRSFLQRFIPRLLPGTENDPAQQQLFVMPTYALVFIALVIPILVGTIAVVVYLQFGQSVQFDEYYSQALNARAQAVSETDPIHQRIAWQNVMDLVDNAENYRQIAESDLLRSEAQANLDTLMGVVRLEFIPAFTNGLGGARQITRLAASESDLYMLDAERGDILHAAFTGRSLELDNSFICQPGTYAGYQVGALVDLLALPKTNAIGAAVLGVDATGNLLYCSPGKVPQAFQLPSLPNTNWGRITAITLDNGNLYVLDATARAVWVFRGKDSAFVDRPYFFFGNQIPETIDTAIDMAVSGDDLYLLHADGHLSTCTFSRIDETPTRCLDPINYQDPFPAHQDINILAQAHFTQVTLTTPPNTVLLLLDSQNQKVFRFTPRSIELQNQITSFSGKGNPFQAGPVGAMTVSPNYVLYLAIGNQVYFAVNLP